LRYKKIILLLIVCIFIVISFFLALGSVKRDSFSDLEVSPSNASYIVVGTSYIEVSPGETVVTQVDRVIRDRASNYNVDVPPDHRPKKL
jgi:hypothetical protein